MVSKRLRKQGVGMQALVRLAALPVAVEKIRVQEEAEEIRLLVFENAVELAPHGCSAESAVSIRRGFIVGNVRH